MLRGPVGSKIQLELINPANNTTNFVEFTRVTMLVPDEHGTGP